MDIAHLEFRDGLYHKGHQILVPHDNAAELRKWCISLHHDPPYIGHVGRERTIELLRRHFLWPKIKSAGKVGYHKPNKRIRGDGGEGPSKPKEYKIPKALSDIRLSYKALGILYSFLCYFSDSLVWLVVANLACRAKFSLRNSWISEISSKLGSIKPRANHYSLFHTLESIVGFPLQRFHEHISKGCVPCARRGMLQYPFSWLAMQVLYEVINNVTNRRLECSVL